MLPSAAGVGKASVVLVIVVSLLGKLILALAN
jgi:hypothetical protein